jgi:hypothetical protein
MPELSTLVADIYSVLDSENDHVASEENLETLGKVVVDVVRTSLRKRDESTGALRMSSIGRPDRQLWYMQNRPDLAEKMPPKAQLKFLYGHVIEALLLFLTKEAGHEVSHEQHEIEVGGVKGHLDAVVDGVTVDVKSAAPYSYKKFEQGTLFSDDPFGYVGQLSSYSSVVTPDRGGAFLAFDKVSGDITTLSIDSETAREYGTEQRVEHLKEVVDHKEPPPRCFSPVPEGKGGNYILGTRCSYCSWKFECWKDTNNGEGLKAYRYYGGPKFFTKILKEPKVEPF